MRSFVFVLALIASVVASQGAVMVLEQWESAADGWTIAGWPSGAEYGSVSATTIDGGRGVTNNALQILGGGFDANLNRDIISVNATGGAVPTGSWPSDLSSLQSVYFDFYVDPSLTQPAPSGLSLFFQTTALDYWFYDFSSYGPNWTTLGANLGPTPGSWYSPTSTDWAGDWQIVSRIGIRLEYLTQVGGQPYGVDNFTLDSDPFDQNGPGISGLVPEPEAYAALGFALLSLGITFRRKIESSMAVLLHGPRGV